MPIGPARMPFLEHLDELRRRLFIVFGTLGVLALVGYFVSGFFLNLVLTPVHAALPKGSEFQFLKPLDPMGLRFTAGLYLAIIVGSPVIIWQAGAFFMPALKPKERRYVIPTFIAAVIFFLTGVAFTYFVMLKPGFEWLVQQAPSGMLVNPLANEFFNLAMILMIVFGISFELPVVVFYLIIFNVIPYDRLKKNRLLIWFILICVAVFGTPDWSPVTMGGLAIALIVLFEGSLIVARIVLRKRIKESREVEEGTAPEMAPAE